MPVTPHDFRRLASASRFRDSCRNAFSSASALNVSASASGDASRCGAGLLGRPAPACVAVDGGRDEDATAAPGLGDPLAAQGSLSTHGSGASPQGAGDDLVTGGADVACPGAFSVASGASSVISSSVSDGKWKCIVIVAASRASCHASGA